MTRQVGDELSERTARLERTEDRIRGIIMMQVEGDRSPLVAQMRKDLEAQAVQERAAIAGLRAHADAPIQLPDIAGISQRVQALDALGRDVGPAREALKRYLKGGTITCTPDDDRFVARAELLPLEILLSTKNEDSGQLGADQSPRVVARGGFEPPTFGL